MIDKQNKEAENQRHYDKHKRDERSTLFYKSKAWKQVRDYIFNKSHGLCDSCREHGRMTPGNVVDHRIPIKQDYSLRLTQTNLWTLCHSCHNKKTKTEDSNYPRHL